MTRASVHDRASVERLYPPDVFEADAAGNARGDASVLHGVRILSAADEGGGFQLTRASQHVGEVHAEGPQAGAGGRFLAPSLAAAATQGGPPSPAERAAEYAAFIDRVVATARAPDFERPIGRGEERLKGFHGG